MLLPKVTFMRIMQQFKKEATHTRSANYIKKLLMLRDLSGPSEAHFINAHCIISFFFKEVWNDCKKYIVQNWCKCWLK